MNNKRKSFTEKLTTSLNIFIQAESKVLGLNGELIWKDIEKINKNNLATFNNDCKACMRIQDFCILSFSEVKLEFNTVYFIDLYFVFIIYISIYYFSISLAKLKYAMITND